MHKIDLIKADALRRLRPYLKHTPSWYQRNAKAKRDEAIRAYLAEIAQAQLTALVDGSALLRDFRRHPGVCFLDRSSQFTTADACAAK